MSQEARKTVSPEMVARGVARGRRLQAKALRDAFKSLFRKAEPKQGQVGGAGQGGFARA